MHPIFLIYLKKGEKIKNKEERRRKKKKRSNILKELFTPQRFALASQLFLLLLRVPNLQRMLKNQKILGSFDDSSVTVFVCCKSGFYVEEMQTQV